MIAPARITPPPPLQWGSPSHGGGRALKVLDPSAPSPRSCKRGGGCNTRTSREVTHPSTTLAQARLTAEFDGIRCINAGMIAPARITPPPPLQWGSPSHGGGRALKALDPSAPSPRSHAKGVEGATLGLPGRSPIPVLL
jgi:hypothetical protein